MAPTNEGESGFDSRESAPPPWRERWLQPLATAVLLGMVWLAFFELSFHERRQTLQAAEGRNENLALALEQYSIRLFRNAEAVTEFVASAYLQGARDAALQQVLALRAANNDAFLEVLMLNADGSLMQTHASRSALGQDRLAVPSSVPDQARLVFGAPLGARPGEDGRIIPLLRPVRTGDGAIAAWSAVLVDSLRFVAILGRARLPEDTVVILASKEGARLAAWGSRGAPAETAPLRGGTPERLDEQARVITVRDFADYPLRVVVGTSVDDILEAFRLRRSRYLWACIAMTAVGTMLSITLLRIQRRRAAIAARLALAKKRLAAANSELEAQVSSRTAQLQQANRDLESFSYSVAHDLRAPLAAIDGFSQALEPAVRAAGNARLTHYLNRLRSNCRHMSDIIDGLLALARVSRAELAAVPVDLTALANDVLASLQERDPRPGLRAQVQAGLVAMGDAALLRQVLENLLGNAWKFLARTAEPQVTVAAVEPARPGEMGFSVRDNGPGFDMAHAGQLFTPFTRLHADQDFPGTGVGLTIVQRIVLLHGGRIHAEAAPGRGAAFYVWLPAPSPAR